MSDSHSHSSSVSREPAASLLIIEGTEPNAPDARCQPHDDLLDLFPSEVPSERQPKVDTISSRTPPSDERGIFEYREVREVPQRAPSIKPRWHIRGRRIIHATATHTVGRALAVVSPLISIVGRGVAALRATGARGLRRAALIVAAAGVNVSVRAGAACRRVAALVVAGIGTASVSAVAVGRAVVASIGVVGRGLRRAALIVAAASVKISVRAGADSRRDVGLVAVTRGRAEAVAVAARRGVVASISAIGVRLRHSASRIAVVIRSISVGAIAVGRDAGRSAQFRVLVSVGAMLALVVIARPFDTFSEWRERLASQPVPGASVSSAAPAPEAAKAPDSMPPVPGQAFTAVAAFRSQVQQIGPVRAPVPTNGPGRRNDTRAIQAVLNRYRDAMSVLDVGAVRTVWPTADVNALRAGFARRVEQNVEFDGCRISPQEDGATASCAGVIESGFSAGNRRPIVERTRWDFTLRKMGTQWRITTVGTRPG